MKSSFFYGLFAALVFIVSPVFADQVPDVQKALSDWKAAVESGSVDNIMKLYDRNAHMISTFAQAPMTKREQIAEYFKKVVSNPNIKVDIQDSHPRIFGNMAIDSGRYTVSYTQEEEPIVIPARFTFVYILTGGKWMIIEQHSSRVPLPDDDK